MTVFVDVTFDFVIHSFGVVENIWYFDWKQGQWPLAFGKVDGEKGKKTITIFHILLFAYVAYYIYIVFDILCVRASGLIIAIAGDLFGDTHACQRVCVCLYAVDGIMESATKPIIKQIYSLPRFQFVDRYRRPQSQRPPHTKKILRMFQS